MTEVTQKNSDVLKVVFGAIIFAFSSAFAYFLASYVDKHLIFDYWGTLIIFAGIYIVVGLIVVNIFPVSLGFLFAADLLVLHAMLENFGDLGDGTKALFVGLILVALYLIAWLLIPEEVSMGEVELSANTSPVVPVVSVAPHMPSVETVALDLDLNENVQKIDTSAFSKVTFYPAGGQAFSTGEPAILRIALYTSRVFGKSEFVPGELAGFFATFISSYKPTLAEEKVQVVLGKMRGFVAAGGKFDIV